MPGQLVSPKRRKNTIIRQLEKALPVIKEKFGIKKIGIFGSYARGEQTRKSDVDILVDFREGEATFDNFMQLADFLEELFKRRVDLLTVTGVDKYIRPRVDAEVIWIEG